MKGTGDLPLAAFFPIDEIAFRLIPLLAAPEPPTPMTESEKYKSCY
jgi:hypothetical protein